MNFAELLVLSVALGTDLFSVAVPIGMNRVGLSLIMRAAVVFAVFHIVMILTGYHVGHWLGSLVEQFGSGGSMGEISVVAVKNWAAIFGGLVLAGLGAHMIKENLSETDIESCAVSHPLKGMPFLVLAFSVSVDALAAGLSLGMIDVNLAVLSLVLGVTIFIIAIAGLGLGRHIGCFIGKRSELVGGLTLVILGGNVLWKAFT